MKGFHLSTVSQFLGLNAHVTYINMTDKYLFGAYKFKFKSSPMDL